MDTEKEEGRFAAFPFSVTPLCFSVPSVFFSLG